MLCSEARSTVLRRRNAFATATRQSSSRYICPSCQFARRKRPHDEAISQPQGIRRKQGDSLSTSPFGQFPIRKFTASTKAQATEHAIQETGNDAPEYNFSIRSGFSIAKSKTPIRESLRLWSAQNEALKQENAPVDVPAEGRITQLPNAIFLKDAGEQIEEDVAQNIDVFADEDINESISMEPGTLFSHEGSLARQYAVYLGMVGVQAQLVLQNGQWSLERLPVARKISSGRRRALVPDFLTPHEIARLKACVPQEAIQRSSLNGNEKNDVALHGLIQGSHAAEILGIFMTKMREFAAEVEEFDRAYGGEIDAAYEKVAHETEWRFVSLEDYAKAAGHDYGTMRDSARMALLNRINDVDHLCCDSTANTIAILCCSRDLKKRMAQVVEWSRDYQDAAVQAALGKDVKKMLRMNPLATFIDKARRLILRSRKIRAPTTIGCLGPTSGDKGNLRKAYTEEEFSESDKSLIDFVWNACFRKPRPLPNGNWKMMPTTSLILRAVGAYPSLTLGSKAGRLFLKELGCADPWAGQSSSDLSLPLPGGRASHKADALTAQLTAAAKKFGAEAELHGGIPPGMDTMAHMRKDWGSLPALAIDPENAEVVEDAISVEPADGIPGGYWMHVHVSHITSCFDPTSVVSRHARHQGSACFVVDGSLPVGMVPRHFTNTFSLRAGAPVLTVSTLVTEDGQILETKISAGTIWNFERLDRRAVEHVLGAEEPEENYAVLVVGKVPYVKRPPVNKEAVHKVLAHKETLELIKRLTNVRLKRRRTEMPVAMRYEKPDYQSGVSTTMVNYRPGPDREHHSYHWKGDPGIILTGKRKLEYQAADERRSADVVTQMMRLAAESAGSWLAQRKIPTIFLGTQASPGNPISKLSQGANHQQTLAPMFHRSSSPLTYWNINMQAYTLCTSPLRRYMDMVACYQMDSYLKAEASGAISPGASVEDESLFAFTTSEIDEYVRTDAGASDTIDIVTRMGKLDYAFQALFRAFHFKESKLPEIWEVLVEEPFKYSATGKEIFANGKLIPFGMDVKVKTCPQGWDKQAGYHQYLPVKIETVDPDQLLIQAVPVGPPSKTQTLLDPIQAWSEDNILDGTESKDSKITSARPL